jgi:hypothetical protein
MLEGPEQQVCCKTLNFSYVGCATPHFVGQKAWPHILLHIEAANEFGASYDIARNARLFAIGAPGIGKTRFGQEFCKLLYDHRKIINDKAMTDRLETPMYIPITLKLASMHLISLLTEK